MSFQIIILIILIIHVACCLLLLAFPHGRLRHRKEYIVPIFIVPLFGPLMAVTIELMFIVGHPGTRPVDLERLELENDIYWSTLVKKQEDKNIIPLEEAILINDTKVRRKAVLDTFREDSFNYLDILMVARDNEDVDTTHYATIQISRIQRQFQLDLQKYSLALEKDPDNMVLLDEYIELLGKYLESSLPEKSILRHQRQIYSNLLDRKLSLCENDKKTLIKKLRNCGNLKEDYPCALEVIDLIQRNWPEDEQVWTETLFAYVQWQDHERFLEAISEMRRTNIDWTKQGRELVSPWVQV